MRVISTFSEVDYLAYRLPPDGVNYFLQHSIIVLLFE